MGQQAGIWVLRLGFGSTGWDFGQQAGILASRLRFGHKALGGTYVMTDGCNGSPLCSTGHRPFGAAAQKGEGEEEEEDEQEREKKKTMAECS